jgi:hypothetical protein
MSAICRFTSVSPFVSGWCDATNGRCWLRRYGHSKYDHAAHGDLFTHEIRLGHEGLLVHELLFERDATFLIECSDIRHSEEPIKRDT